ncbi:hypothetical protein AC629_16265 [Bradyrhizobium sp. NAS80.1]|uniref:hypothetical protein n=1 Tax=Bradyrhizobium sp. NAS80.1 TaxID=1680159 RepID=UPI00096811DE|nr:hypothetical protein [Bradyrhizobium sp. NAS80.1]OKO86624.1 hypothetical protein AC629_16265 [Bradyrhizobium sp. NAS80.1]
MKFFGILLSLMITIRPAVAEESSPDFSGAWKRDCAKAYGLKVSRAEASQFSVTFCYPTGCGSKPWIPNTPIAGDPKFKVVSETEIRVRRVDIPDAWLMYYRCSRDPSWTEMNPAERPLEADSDPALK